ncbi:MAG: substrate-binding domain-containing protein [Steroidobacteraceae bacterium]
MKSSSKLIAAAVATVLGTSAHALAPTATITYSFYEAGGSAQENSVYSALYNLLTPSTVDVYTDTGKGLSGSYLIVTGTTNPSAANAPFTTATNILFIYKFNHGSFPNGAFPLAYASGSANSLLAYPTVASILSATATGNSGTPTPSNPSYTFTAVDSNNQPTDFGVTDVEVPLFNYPYNLNGTPALTPPQLAGIAQEGIYDDVFGIAVTNTVYKGTSAFAHPKTSFTKSEIAGILSGTITNWAQLFADDGTQFPSKPIWFLDRGSGSGTKAGENQYFLNYPGSIGYSGAALKPNSVTASNVNGGYSDTILNLSGGYQDVEEASTAACVTDLENANAAGDYAITVLATQEAPALNLVGGATAYSFVKIDGVGIDTGGATDNINGTTSTSYTNVVTGAYDYFLQNSFNYRSGLLVASSPGSITTAPAGSPPNVAIAYAIRNNLQASSLAGANSGKAFPLSVTGVLVDPVLAAAQVAGVVLDTRNRVTAAPLQPSFDATDSGASGAGGSIAYGVDPL